MFAHIKSQREKNMQGSSTDMHRNAELVFEIHGILFFYFAYLLMHSAL